MTLTPSLEEKRKAWDVIFNDPELSVDTLRQRAISGTVCQQGLRSVCWKIFLGYLPDLELSTWPATLIRERQRYTELRRKYIEESAERMSGRKKDDEPEDLSSNNPLALNDHNPWQQYFVDTEMRKVILQDVERTFPDVDFFRQAEVQQHLTDILFIYCKINRDVSYRQGMHELLAPFYWALQHDSLNASSLNQDVSFDSTTNTMAQVLDPQFVEHDVYILFEKLMLYGKAWYEFSDQVAPAPSRKPASENSKYKTELVSKHIPKPDENARLNPIVKTCHRIHHTFLRTVDPALYDHLESFGIEPQLYGIRWIRLLFGREFDFSELLKLWDAIFAQDPKLDIVDYICVVILLRIRDQLLQKDYAECLSLLMRPLPTQFILKPASIVEQARLLRENLSADTALHILQQMDLRSGKEPRITLEVTKDTNNDYNDHTKDIHGNRLRSSSAATSSSASNLPYPLQHKSSSQGFESFAKNMMKNPQVRDLNRAIAGVMGTVQKNVNAFGSRYQQQQEFSSEFPSGIDRVIHDKRASTASRPTSYHSSTTASNPYKPLTSVPAATVVESQRQGISFAQQRQMGEMLAKCITLLEDEMFPSTNVPSSSSEMRTDSTELSKSAETEKINYGATPSEDSNEATTVVDNKRQNVNLLTDADAKEKEQQQQQRRDAKLVMALVGLKHIRDIMNGKQTHFDANLLNVSSGKTSRDETERRRSSTKDEWQFVDHPTMSPTQKDAPLDDATTVALQPEILKYEQPSSSQKEQSPSFGTLSQSSPASINKNNTFAAPTYVSKHPTPIKQPVKYRIEDLLSDPELQRQTDSASSSSSSNKLKWMLTENKEQQADSSSSSSNSSSHNKTLFSEPSTAASNNTKEDDLKPSALLRKRKSHSFVVTQKHASNDSITKDVSDSGSSSSQRNNDSLDPLDAQNVDNKKFYDDGF